MNYDELFAEYEKYREWSRVNAAQTDEARDKIKLLESKVRELEFKLELERMRFSDFEILVATKIRSKDARIRELEETK